MSANPLYSATEAGPPAPDPTIYGYNAYAGYGDPTTGALAGAGYASAPPGAASLVGYAAAPPVALPSGSGAHTPYPYPGQSLDYAPSAVSNPMLAMPGNGSSAYPYDYSGGYVHAPISAPSADAPPTSNNEAITPSAICTQVSSQTGIYTIAAGGGFLVTTLHAPKGEGYCENSNSIELLVVNGSAEIDGVPLSSSFFQAFSFSSLRPFCFVYSVKGATLMIRLAAGSTSGGLPQPVGELDDVVTATNLAAVAAAHAASDIPINQYCEPDSDGNESLTAQALHAINSVLMPPTGIRSADTLLSLLSADASPGHFATTSTSDDDSTNTHHNDTLLSRKLFSLVVSTVAAITNAVVAIPCNSTRIFDLLGIIEAKIISQALAPLPQPDPGNKKELDACFIAVFSTGADEAHRAERWASAGSSGDINSGLSRASQRSIANTIINKICQHADAQRQASWDLSDRKDSSTLSLLSFLSSLSSPIFVDLDPLGGPIPGSLSIIDTMNNNAFGSSNDSAVVDGKKDDCAPFGFIDGTLPFLEAAAPLSYWLGSISIDSSNYFSFLTLVTSMIQKALAWLLHKRITFAQQIEAQLQEESRTNRASSVDDATSRTVIPVVVLLPSPGDPALSQTSFYEDILKIVRPHYIVAAGPGDNTLKDSIERALALQGPAEEGHFGDSSYSTLKPRSLIKYFRVKPLIELRAQRTIDELARQLVNKFKSIQSLAEHAINALGAPASTFSSGAMDATTKEGAPTADNKATAASNAQSSTITRAAKKIAANQYHRLEEIISNHSPHHYNINEGIFIEDNVRFKNLMMCSIVEYFCGNPTRPLGCGRALVRLSSLRFFRALSGVRGSPDISMMLPGAGAARVEEVPLAELLSGDKGEDETQRELLSEAQPRAPALRPGTLCGLSQAGNQREVGQATLYGLVLFVDINQDLDRAVIITPSPESELPSPFLLLFDHSHPSITDLRPFEAAVA